MGNGDAAIISLQGFLFVKKFAKRVIVPSFDML